MKTVTISPKFQIVIPKEVRESMKLKSGMKVFLVPYQGKIEIIPLVPMETLRGTLKGMDTGNIREKNDRDL